MILIITQMKVVSDVSLNFEDSELLVPYYRLKEAGVEVSRVFEAIAGNRD
jgi:putative intracellular protease/amidase